MSGTILDDLEDVEAIQQAVLDELIDLRGAYGRLTIEKFGEYPTLRRVCGGSDLLDAYLMFEREMRRYSESGSRDEAAAAISITAEAETVLDRLEHVVSALPQDGEIRDQRTGRRWSDRGIERIAAELVHLAEVQGRLGQELMTVEIYGDLDTKIKLVVSQLTNKSLDEKPPFVRVWRNQDNDEDIEEVLVDLSAQPVPSVEDENFKLRRYHLEVDLATIPGAQGLEAGDPIYAISVEGRDAPMRSVSFVNFTSPHPQRGLRFTTYRTISSVEIVDNGLANNKTSSSLSKFKEKH